VYRVLLAEDEELVRRAIIATVNWEAHGFVLAGSAKDGGEALSLIFTMKPDLVVTDIKMPVLDGISLIRMAREEMDEEDQPVFVVLTAHSDFDYARQAVKLDVADFLLKPLDEDELASTLEKIRAKLDRKARSGILETLSGADPALLSLANADSHAGGESAELYVSQAIEEINRCFSSDLTLEDAASRLGISEGYLARVFRKKTGKTFFDYLTFVRMRQAMELLLDPAARIQEVAAAVGYTDQRNFSQRFRQVVGCTPTEFRQGKGGSKRQGEPPAVKIFP